jgi:hypothetical protein
MTEGSETKARHRFNVDQDWALYLEVDPNRKFTRIVSKDQSREARTTALKAIRDIDVSTAKGVAAKTYFEGMLDRADAGIEGSCLVIYGRTGAGKSHIIKRLVSHPDLKPQETPEGKYRPLLKLVAPAPCTLRSLGLQILRRLGYRSKKKLNEYEVWDRVSANLYAQGVAILVIDEMHNVLKGRNAPERAKIGAAFKSLMVSEDNPMQLVLAGLIQVKTFVDADSEVHRRSHFVELAPLRATEDAKKYTNFLESLDKAIGMKTCKFHKGDMPIRFYFASRGLIGRMAYFAQEAATIAVTLNHDSVTEEHLGEAFRRPHEVARGENPFLIPNISMLKIPKGAKAIANDDETFLRGTKKQQDEDEDE